MGGIALINARGKGRIAGQNNLTAQTLGTVQNLPRPLGQIWLMQGGPDPVPLGMEEGVGHAAADDQEIYLGY